MTTRTAGARGGERSREVRLGVVMFGGVSLAVYINGVSSELFRAVRGRGVYRLLKALTDSHIVVDVLSGASAGGINSVLLATALCNDRDFTATAELWREHADIGRLMARSQAGMSERNSILEGEYHHAQLRAALEALLGGERGVSPQAEDPSPVNELDLFITGTDIDGHKSAWTDALGHRVQLQNHRVLFRLKHRPGRKTPFSTFASQDGTPGAQAASENVEALATLAHITSCFPGAFSPVKVVIPTAQVLKKSGRETGTVAGRLSYWGALQAHECPGEEARAREAIFMDGGVLKNKPFSSTIDAIFLRLADRQVSRYMLYVDPDPAASVQPRPVHPDHADPARRLISIAAAGASVLPRFESIDLDLAQVEVHNQQVRRYEALLRTATAAVLYHPAPKTDPQSAAAEAYRRARASGMAYAVIEALSLDKAKSARTLPGERPRIPGLAGLLDRIAGNAERFDTLCEEFDVLFGFRRLLQLTYLVDDSARIGLRAGQRQVPFRMPSRSFPFLEGASFSVDAELLSRINRQIEFYLVVRARLEQDLLKYVDSSLQPLARLGEAGFWSELASRARLILQTLPVPECFPSDTSAGQGARGLTAGVVTSEELDALRGREPSAGQRPAPAFSSNILKRAEAYERGLLAGCPELLNLYQRFEQIDEVTQPLELVSELTGRDQIRTVRFSPLDSRRAFAGQFERKLCGQQLFAFGAFFKKSWRCNDILWGRLDGASQLLDLLLDVERLSQLEQPLISANLRAVVGETFDLAEFFPHSQPADRERLQGWLTQLASGDTPSALAELRGDELPESWAKAVQLEVLVEELPRVLEAAAAESISGVERAELYGFADRIRQAAALEAGSLVEAYFNPRSYTLAQQLLPGAMPEFELDAIRSKAGERLKEAVLQSVSPPDTLLHATLRGVVSMALDGALWVAGRCWVSPKGPKPPSQA